MFKISQTAFLLAALAATPTLAQTSPGQASQRQGGTSQQVSSAATAQQATVDCSKPSDVSKADQCRNPGNGDAVAGYMAFMRNDKDRATNGKMQSAMTAADASMSSFQAMYDCDKFGQCGPAPTERPLLVTRGRGRTANGNR